jgi:glycosyltransferase involved in cell wall biosynthesis
VELVREVLAVMGAPGCDDAPVVRVKRADVAQRDVTVVYPYYENPDFLVKQMSHWLKIPQEVRTYVSFIVVDDGSPNNPAENILRDPARLLPIRLFRIEVDVRWNWLAARNIGAHYADDGWLLITDMDHVIPVDTLRAVLCGKLKEDFIYRFSRTGAKTHPHPNSWLYTRETYWRIGGYDEALSGHYGTDSEYRRRCAATAPIRILEEPLELHEHEGDASTVRYLRKQPEDAAAKQMIRARGSDWEPKVLSFPHHEVRL